MEQVDEGIRALNDLLVEHPNNVQGHEMMAHLLAEKGEYQNAITEYERAIAHDINRRDDQFTPLHLAAEDGHKEIVALLLDDNSDVNTKTKTNWTPMHSAAISDHVQIAELLLAKQADVQAKEGGSVVDSSSCRSQICWQRICHPLIEARSGSYSEDNRWLYPSPSGC